MSKNRFHIVLLSLVVLGGLFIAGMFGLPALFHSALEGEKSHDFGIVDIERPFTILEHTFRLKNVTDHALQLADAVSTCGCTTTDWPDQPVQAGEEFIVPVHLKLERSQLRGSKIRLEFESGEIVTLKIKGTGRFIQPLQCLPPILSIVNGNKQGTRCLLSLEWYKVSNPPLPTFDTPEHIRVETNQWRLSKEGDYNRGVPDQWSLQLTVFLDGALEQESDLLIDVAKNPTLHVPLKQVDSVDKPLLRGPNVGRGVDNR